MAFEHCKTDEQIFPLSKFGTTSQLRSVELQKVRGDLRSNFAQAERYTIVLQQAGSKVMGGENWPGLCRTLSRWRFEVKVNYQVLAGKIYEG